MRFFCALFFFIVSFVEVGLSTVQIEEIGLRGYFSTVSATPVRIRVSNLSYSGPIHLAVSVTTGRNVPSGPLRTDAYTLNADFTSNEDLEVDIPVSLTYSNGSELEVIVTDSAGRKIESSSRDLDSPLSSVSRTDQNIVLILCREPTICDEAQSQINLSGSPQEVANKNSSMRFVQVDTPRATAWDYQAAHSVVVAEPVSAWSKQQQQAVEDYARDGGTLVLLERELANPALLSNYRQGPPGPGPIPIGKGKLFRVVALADKGLGRIFEQSSSNILGWEYQPRSQTNPADWLLDEVGVSFTIPRFRWFLTWLSVYILIVGLVNFMLLRRLKRLEWGWFTTPAIAFAFAFSLYIASTANRPKHTTLDNVAVYWMDPRTGIAAEDIRLRLSSPSRQDIDFAMRDAAILLPEWNEPGVANVDIAGELSDVRQIQPGLDVNLGPPLRVHTSLLRGSFKDFNLETMHVFPGSVVQTNSSHLKNETGQYFKKALYFDSSLNKRYAIPKMGAGEEIDLRECVTEPIDAVTTETRGGQQIAFSRLIRGFIKNGTKSVFVGFSDGPVSATELSIGNFIPNNAALTIVAFN